MQKPSKNQIQKVFSLILSWLNASFKEDRIKSLSDYDWALINEVARKKSLTAFIFYKFKTQNSLRFLPQAILDSWQQHFYNNLKRNEIALSELSQSLSRLQSSNISVILLKGASLLIDGHHNLALRVMGDADILIKKDDIAKAVQVLKEAGFNLVFHSSADFIGEFETDLLFSNHDFYLEVFPNLYQYERFKGALWNNHNDVWGNSRIVDFNGQPIRILSCEDQILHLCQHICIEHLLSDIVHFLDIRELISDDSLNWSKLLDEAGKQNLCCCLYYAIIFTKKLFCIDIPEGVMKQLRPALLKIIFVNLFINKNEIFSFNAPETKRYILQFLFMDKISDGFKVALRGFIPSKEWFLYRYGKSATWKVYLYRIAHPFKVLFGKARSAFKNENATLS